MILLNKRKISKKRKAVTWLCQGCVLNVGNRSTGVCLMFLELGVTGKEEGSEGFKMYTVLFCSLFSKLHLTSLGMQA